jgi:hypothetical protein
LAPDKNSPLRTDGLDLSQGSKGRASVIAAHKDDQPAVASLLADLHKRIVAYARGGSTDPMLVLSDEAEANARDLWRAAQSASLDGSVPFDVVNTIAWLHFHRYAELPVGQDRKDLQAALVLFAHVYRVDPELVPNHLLQMRYSDYNDELVIPDNARHVPDGFLGRHAFEPESYSSSSYPASSLSEVSDGPDWWTRKAELILQREQTAGDPDDLDFAIDLLQSALSTTPFGHPDRPAQLTNLCGALGRRYERSKDLADLVEAITVARAALETSPDRHPDRAGMLSNLCLILRLRFERVGDLADLEEAIRAGYAAVEATPADHPSRAGFESNLARALQHKRCEHDFRHSHNEWGEIEVRSGERSRPFTQVRECTKCGETERVGDRYFADDMAEAHMKW